MELHERLTATSTAEQPATNGKGTPRARALRGPQEPDSHDRDRRARSAALGGERRSGRDARARRRDGPAPPADRDRDLPRGPRADHRRADRRHPRLRAARATARRRLDHGDHGQRPERDLDRASGTPVRDDGPVHRRIASPADHQQDRRPDRPPHRRGVADGRRPAAGRLPRQRDHPAAVALRAARHDPQVLEEAPDAGRHGQPRHAVRRGRRVPAPVRRRGAQHHGQRRYRHR